ncbi:MAG: helicase-related protein, partial [Actinomycetota bacterium]
LEAFASGEVLVMVATDIAARGIHVDDIGLVVHVDPPAEHKAFLHRSGRTARAGASGTVVTVMTPDQKSDVDVLTRRAGIQPQRTKVQPNHPLIAELTGPVAPKRMREIPQAQPQGQKQGQKQGQPRGRRSGGAKGKPAGPGVKARSSAPARSAGNAGSSQPSGVPRRPGSPAGGARRPGSAPGASRRSKPA